MEQNTSVRGGVGFTGLLTIAFVILKLCGVIQWSWVWVLSPIWISVALALLIVVVVLVFAAMVDEPKRTKGRW